jgi:hypothetical protein
MEAVADPFGFEDFRATPTLRETPPKPRSLFDTLSGAYDKYLDPNRASLQAAPKVLADKAAEIAKAEISAAQQAKAALAPSMIRKYGPLAVVGGAGALAADAATGGSVLGVFSEDPEKVTVEDMRTGTQEFEARPGFYGFDRARFYGIYCNRRRYIR